MPRLGQIVIYRQAKDEGNHSQEAHAAIVTTVHSDVLVNLKVFFEGADIENRTSVPHRDRENDDQASWNYD